MTKEDIIGMAREAGDWNGQTAEFNDIGLERFAALVAAHEREKVAQWMVERSYATGHGDTIEDLLTEIDWQSAEREREGCVKVCLEQIEAYTSSQYTTDPLGGYRERFGAGGCAAAIRARGEK
jgi:hypothetical protein